MNGWIGYQDINQVDQYPQAPIDNQDLKLLENKVIGLTLNYETDTIYFSDLNSKTLRSIYRNGTGLRVLATRM